MISSKFGVNNNLLRGYNRCLFADLENLIFKGEKTRSCMAIMTVTYSLVSGWGGDAEPGFYEVFNGLVGN